MKNSFNVTEIMKLTINRPSQVAKAHVVISIMHVV